MSTETGHITRFMAGAPAISSRMEKILEAELRSGEHVAWCQQPNPDALARKSLSTFLLGIPFTGFALFWIYAASGGSDHSTSQKGSWPLWFPLLWGGMFVVFGLRFLLSPLTAYWKALRTVYAITDQRAMIITAPFWKRTVFTFFYQQLVETHRVENEKGCGDIIFHRQVEPGRRRNYYYDQGFLGINNVRETENKLRELYEKTRLT
jgi:hypothetical protein